MDRKKLPKEQYCLPEFETITACSDTALAASVGGGQTEDLGNEDWDI